MMDRSIHEECGVFGVFNHPNAAHLTYLGLHALQHRGQEGVGIVTSDGIDLHQHKGEGLVRHTFHEGNLKKLLGSHAIGHVRYTTTGGGGLLNVQPFLFQSQAGALGLCHNGNLVNARAIKTYLEQKGSIFQTSSDSEVVAHLLKRHRGKFEERLKESLLYIEGAFAFLFLLENELYAALDKHGMRPLSIGKIDQGFIIASETCALDAVGATHLRDVMPGEIVKFSDQGMEIYNYAEDSEHRMCAMEYVYFARPDSNIEGLNVYQARKKSGQRLAQEAPVDADIVIGVPDSGMSAALGYAQEANIPLEIGMLKNKYSSRTFIEPNQSMREEAVNMKLSTIDAIIRNKRVILVDDSIVRGTTIHKLVRLLKMANAKEIHVRIAAPEIKYPCFYGVDFSTYDELISAHKNPSELAKLIDVDSVAFLSIEGLEKSTERGHKLCKACFNGDYPTHLYEGLDRANREKK